MNKIIEQVFEEMVLEIQKTKTTDIEPNRYHKSASVSEVNLVYHFTKQLEKRTDYCAVYLEFPCDSGRVDAVVLYENNILLIEAKSNMNNKKYKVLNAQATRFKNVKIDRKTDFEVEDWIKRYYQDSSLRDTLKDRVYSFMSKKWDIKNVINIYGILLADTVSANEKNKWGYKNNIMYYGDNKLNTMKNYTFLNIIKDNNNAVWYLGSYRKIDVLDI